MMASGVGRKVYLRCFWIPGRRTTRRSDVSKAEWEPPRNVPGGSALRVGHQTSHGARSQYELNTSRCLSRPERRSRISGSIEKPSHRGKTSICGILLPGVGPIRQTIWETACMESVSNSRALPNTPRTPNTPRAPNTSKSTHLSKEGAKVGDPRTSRIPQNLCRDTLHSAFRDDWEEL